MNYGLSKSSEWNEKLLRQFLHIVCSENISLRIYKKIYIDNLRHAFFQSSLTKHVTKNGCCLNTPWNVYVSGRMILGFLFKQSVDLFPAKALAIFFSNASLLQNRSKLNKFGLYVGKWRHRDLIVKNLFIKQRENNLSIRNPPSTTTKKKVKVLRRGKTLEWLYKFFHIILYSFIFFILIY